MAFFAYKRTPHVDGPDVEDIHVTFENLCAELRSSVYTNGVDPETLTATIGDIYKWITGTSHGSALRLPAPMDDIEDQHRTMWPEGAKVRTRSRRDSMASRGSSITSNGIRVPKMSVPRTNSVVSSNRSARYPVVRAHFIEDEHVGDDDVYNVNLHTIRSMKPNDYLVPVNATNAGGARLNRSSTDPVPNGRRTSNAYQQPGYAAEIERVNTRDVPTALRTNGTKAVSAGKSKPQRQVFIDDD